VLQRVILHQVEIASLNMQRWKMTRWVEARGTDAKFQWLPKEVVYSLEGKLVKDIKPSSR
jgi:hypothetical protein